MPALDWQTPLTITWPKPQPSRTCVIMLSGWEIGAGVIACTDVATNKAKEAPAINLIICSSLNNTHCPLHSLPVRIAGSLEIDQGWRRLGVDVCSGNGGQPNSSVERNMHRLD